MPVRGSCGRMLLAAAAACASLLLFSIPVSASAVPERACLRVAGRIDVGAFERAAANRYHVRFRKIVATDIDRDGDLDLIAATDLELTVWVNDGRGMLTSQRSVRGPMIDRQPPASTSDGRQAPLDEPIQPNPPSVRVPFAYAHGPPDAEEGQASQLPSVVRVTSKPTARSPRAPPL